MKIFNIFYLSKISFYGYCFPFLNTPINKFIEIKSNVSFGISNDNIINSCYALTAYLIL
jgi:hypothetical protein